jgi:hypothetical protein
MKSIAVDNLLHDNQSNEQNFTDDMENLLRRSNITESSIAQTAQYKYKGPRVHIHVATNNVESTLLFHPPTHPPTPDNVDRYSVVF